MKHPQILMLLLATALPAQSEPVSAETGDSRLAEAERQLMELCARVIPATVALQSGGSGGSGVIVSEDGLVLTAAHVFREPGRTLRIILHDGRRVAGRTLGKMNDDDFGLVRITANGPFPFAPMGRSGDLKSGAPLIATGHPGGYQSSRPPVLRFGIYQRSTPNALQTTCVIEQGDSGGPLFNLQGEVVGIHSRISTGQSQNYHVPIDLYRDHWDRLLAEHEWPAGLGIRGEDGEHDGVAGCRVLRVEPEMGAAIAGIAEGDFIVQADGNPVNGIRALRTALASRAAGDLVPVVLLRKEERVTLEVRLGALR